MKMKTKIMLFLLIFLLAGCSKGPDAPPQFECAEIVEHKLSGLRGQIIDRYSAAFWDKETGYLYTVRLVVHQKEIPYRLLGSGGPLREKPLATMRLWECELQKIKD
jgi:hypothetical protein